MTSTACSAGAALGRDPGIGRRLERRHARERGRVGARRDPDQDREMDRSTGVSHRPPSCSSLVVLVLAGGLDGVVTVFVLTTTT